MPAACAPTTSASGLSPTYRHSAGGQPTLSAASSNKRDRRLADDHVGRSADGALEGCDEHAYAGDHVAVLPDVHAVGVDRHEARATQQRAHRPRQALVAEIEAVADDDVLDVEVVAHGQARRLDLAAQARIAKHVNSRARPLVGNQLRGGDHGRVHLGILERQAEVSEPLPQLMPSQRRIIRHRQNRLPAALDVPERLRRPWNRPIRINQRAIDVEQVGAVRVEGSPRPHQFACMRADPSVLSSAMTHAVGAVRSVAERLCRNVERVLVGKRGAIELAVVAVLCEGHLLIEDVPGIGKTTMARALARSIGGTFRRLQCTPDLLPSDVTGVSVFDQRTAEFVFRPGPIFANVLLADEINRATPRTQSAVLEAMQEAQVSADGVTRPLPRPFLVLATQNPVELEGTFPLPEAQLDRFLLRLSLGYPSEDDEERMVGRGSAALSADALEAVAMPDDVQRRDRRVRQGARPC